MTPALWLVTLTAGLTLGWNAALLGPHRRKRGHGRGRSAARPRPSSGSQVIGAGPALYDWRTDPAICACPACHGSGRFPTFLGHIERCPCGARRAS